MCSVGPDIGACTCKWSEPSVHFFPIKHIISHLGASTYMRDYTVYYATTGQYLNHTILLNTARHIKSSVLYFAKISHRKKLYNVLQLSGFTRARRCGKPGQVKGKRGLPSVSKAPIRLIL